MVSVVVSTADVVGTRMASPGIRAWHLANEVAKHYPTVLIAKLENVEGLGNDGSRPGGSPAPDSRLRTVQHGSRESRNALAAADIVISQPDRQILGALRKDQLFFCDLFDPVVLELQELYRSGKSLRQRTHYLAEWHRLRVALKRADVLISATRRQVGFYAGVYAADGGDDPGWPDRWIDVPFGIENSLKDVMTDLEGQPPTIVWGGGVWGWLDPETAVEAVSLVNQRGVPCRLLFLGGSRPNVKVGAAAEKRLAWKNLESPGSAQIVWNTTWIPYLERTAYLVACRAAIMLHRKTLEAEFAIRTRLFDAIGCSLPVVVSDGGFAADLVVSEGLGLVTRPGDVEGVASAIERLVNDDGLHSRFVSNLERVSERYRWSRVANPLIEKITELTQTK